MPLVAQMGMGGLRENGSVKILALVTEAFGGSGGIAQSNRDLFSSIAADASTQTVIVPRFGSAGELPANVRQKAPSPSKPAYAVTCLKTIYSDGPFDVILCGHLHMAYLAYCLSRLVGASYWLQIHGIEAWKKPGAPLRAAAERARLVTAVSRFTRRKFLEWAKIESSRVKVLPNTLDPRFTPGERPPYLVDRYALEGKKILLTVSRLAARERYKGHDKVIEVMPALLKEFPGLVYVIVGDGDDRPRLSRLAEERGIGASVVFAGQVSDEELPDFYRLADVFVMPSLGEGFGIAFLEAAASGKAVVAGSRDGSVDAVLEGRGGDMVDPENALELRDRLREILKDPSRRHALDPAVAFSRENHRAGVSGILRYLEAMPDA